MKNIIVKTMNANFIKNFKEVTSEISNLKEIELQKGLEGFYKAYSCLPNLFDCGDVESILYYVNK